jgi:cellulose synthase/poly-beta-1,6-N-acetylglucosamine synthase-like glycosyltransferase
MTRENNPKLSIIIPVKEFNQNLDECIKHCLELDYPDYEIIVLPDFSIELYYNVRVVPTGVKGPSDKRNIGIKEAAGEIIAFLDDDAFPPKDWLRNAVRNFNDGEIAAVGGPAVTPGNDGLKEKASGSIYSSFLGGGVYRYRYIPRKKRFVDDFPSCNFIVRKSVLKEAGGFKTKFWPGEDTALCLEITKKLGKRMVYDPAALVYHHRRKLFIPHLKQVCNYALHRGYFVKRFPQTSLRISYFLPTLFVFGLFFGWLLGFIHPLFYKIYLISTFVYFSMALLTGLKNGSPFTVSSGLILTHSCYGIWFLKGLFSRRLSEE